MKRLKTTVLSTLLGMLVMEPTGQAQVTPLSPDQLRERERLLNFLSQGVTAYSQGLRSNDPQLRLNTTAPGGAWWTNTALVERLGLTEEQKSRIERTFENHRQNIVTTTMLLEKEEAQLNRLLEAEPLDKNAVQTQIDRVIQARGEMERANSAMTLEMREQLTRAQWLQLPRVGVSYTVTTTGGGGRGQRTGGGQRSPDPTGTGTTPQPGGRRGGRGPQ
jgi:Spy/CpxP family protein refolding chaperone